MEFNGNEIPTDAGKIKAMIQERLVLDVPVLIAEKIGEPIKELEQICICKNAIFWSFDRKNYAKENWRKNSKQRNW